MLLQFTIRKRGGSFELLGLGSAFRVRFSQHGHVPTSTPILNSRESGRNAHTSFFFFSDMFLRADKILLAAQDEVNIDYKDSEKAIYI